MAMKVMRYRARQIVTSEKGQAYEKFRRDIRFPSFAIPAYCPRAVCAIGYHDQPSHSHCRHTVLGSATSYGRRHALYVGDF
jgi:hypothetical protein